MPTLSTWLSGVIDTFVAKVDGNDWPLAVYFNTYQDVLHDIETSLGINVWLPGTTLKDRLTRTLLETLGSNVQTITGTYTLLDTMPYLNIITPSGADREVRVPAGSTSNHGFAIVNPDATHALNIKTNDGVTLIGVISPHSASTLVPTGSTYYLSGGAGGGGNLFFIDCSGGTSDTYGVLVGAVNGTNTDFTVSAGSYSSGSLTVSKNGQLLTQGTSEDWVELSPAAGTFRLSPAPAAGSILLVKYQKSASSTGDADTLDGLHASSFMLTRVTREVLTANRDYYVRTDGNDANTGLTNTAGGAFLTVQKAIDVTSMLDMGIYDVTIHIADGTYSVSTPITLKSSIGSGCVYITGNTTTPANVILTSAASLTALIYADKVSTVYRLSGFKLTKTGSANYGLNLLSGSKVFASLLDFGSGFGMHIRVELGAVLEITGNYTISGGAGRHIFTGSSGLVRVYSGSAITITLTGTPAFSVNTVETQNSTVIIDAATVTFSGSATGVRYSVYLNGVINTGGGASYIPGNSAGSTATGGQYV